MLPHHLWWPQQTQASVNLHQTQNHKTKGTPTRSSRNGNSDQTQLASSVTKQGTSQNAAPNTINQKRLQTAPPTCVLTKSGLWTAASHNITFDFSNLNIHLEYDGQYEVAIGDGTDLSVSLIVCLLNFFTSNSL